MSTFVLNSANDHLFQLAKTQLTEAIEYFRVGDYDRSFRSLVGSIRKSGCMLGSASETYVPQEIFTHPGMKNDRIDDQYRALAELLDAFDAEDEKLDLLCAFLDDSGLEAMSGAQTRYRLLLYRQMILSFVAGLDNRCVSASEAATPEELERFLDLKFAVAAYLESLLAYQQWCLEFVEEHGLSHRTGLAGCGEEAAGRQPSLAM